MPEITPKQPGKPIEAKASPCRSHDLDQVVGVQQAEAGVIEIPAQERTAGFADEAGTMIDEQPKAFSMLHRSSCEAIRSPSGKPDAFWKARFSSRCRGAALLEECAAGDDVGLPRKLASTPLDGGDQRQQRFGLFTGEFGFLLADLLRRPRQGQHGNLVDHRQLRLVQRCCRQRRFRPSDDHQSNANHRQRPRPHGA